MKIIKPYYLFETPIDGEHRDFILRLIERAARTCYKSECKIERDSASEFVRKIVRVHKHESVIEHASASVRFVIDRGVSHELVRHRLAAFSQESTRYCNYGNDKFEKEITVIDPCFFKEGSESWNEWLHACRTAEKAYLNLLKIGRSAQEARSVLPNSLKTEVVMTCNMREWRHVFDMRADEAAHPQMREVMVPLLADFKRHLPELFDDL